ncbi:MAG: hypothetical protein UT56_C0006G0015 [Candidatus Levybacteria bacterium GW2011_GWB1_39_7]|nr:MAG: hypothetical protein UT20_C0004G0017 [Candidatus Levybacteria bacterium GW2011_GWA1_39_11]KKR24918.1 MAG: hypothetical protein UT56_C0006G0015 [Candidatus Levybacteria bacterium GW2011_GWB1_39_7]KKR27213.1 MAG: hypothetical protein UT57_C0014G0002 [Microgenomates group bacterium GW2011_GWC1_39_7]KKR49944.1 MAG: hypothetical protein UT85_C0008G0015 [Candidatus Levybacteria bacterium GW2011_GWA2_40_16]
MTVFAQTNSATLKSRQILKERLDAIKEERKQKIEEFKEKIAAIKDERKKALVEKIVEKISNSNERLTARMSAALARLSSILKNLSEKAANLKASGKDTSELEKAISQAETAIEEAKSAVAAQAEKKYSANLINDSTLRNAIGEMISQFRKDLRDAHKKVAAARQAISKAVAELAQLGGVRNSATQSGNMD